MSSINSVRNLQISNFSRKNKEIKKLKKDEKKCAKSANYTYYCPAVVEVFIFMNADFLQSGRITNKKGDLKVVMCHKKD